MCVFVCAPHTYLVPEEFRDIGFPISSVKDSYEPPCGCLEPNPGFLQE